MKPLATRRLTFDLATGQPKLLVALYATFRTPREAKAWVKAARKLTQKVKGR